MNESFVKHSSNYVHNIFAIYIVTEALPMKHIVSGGRLYDINMWGLYDLLKSTWL